MKIFKRILVGLFLLLVALVIAFYFAVKVEEPEVSQAHTATLERSITSDSLFFCGNNWLKRNQYGIWEMYVEGDAFQRGYVNGLLSKEHVVQQEVIFVGRLNDMLPGKFYQTFLKLVVGWFNRHLDENIPLEYKKEIYGVSLSASPDFQYIAPNYQRILNYHAAHDIGHAMQNMNLVACTSVGVWGSRTADSSLLIGRNFDFYMGEEFAKEKIVLFQKPDSGYKFMSVTWGGMIGVVSGMNEHGLTITLNAAKSGLPGGAATPVSIIARDILQYAKNIPEAYKIASNYKSFVSESFMVGSKQDGKVAIIEKGPEKTTLFFPKENLVTCANHFQGTEWISDSLNIENINESPTEFRRLRLLELINTKSAVTPASLAEVLRDRMGINGQNLGMGNEKALNQFVAHHSIIFNPTKGIVWVSSNPYQLGAYVPYDLNKIFSEKVGLRKNEAVHEAQCVLPADSFQYTTQFKELLFFKATTENIRKIVWNEGEGKLSDADISHYLASNPHYYHTYMMLGDYYRAKKNLGKAIENYQVALTKDIPRTHDKAALQERIKECQETKN